MHGVLCYIVKVSLLRVAGVVSRATDTLRKVMPILDWLNKEQAVTAAQKFTYRLLEEVPELSYGDADNENLLIQGDNLKL